jgi:hypothetical protein
MFTLADFGKMMVSVRSPSMIQNSSNAPGNQTKLFSLRDFERALVKLRNRSEQNKPVVKRSMRERFLVSSDEDEPEERVVSQKKDDAVQTAERAEDSQGN